MWFKRKNKELSPDLTSDELTALLYRDTPEHYLLYLNHPHKTQHIQQYIAEWCYNDTLVSNKSQELVETISLTLLEDPALHQDTLTVLWFTRPTWNSKWHAKVIEHPNADTPFLLEMYLHHRDQREPALADLTRERLSFPDVLGVPELIAKELGRKPGWKEYLVNRMRELGSSEEDLETLDHLPLDWVEETYKLLHPDDTKIMNLIRWRHGDDLPPF